jgi:hypothetical protein
MSRTDPLSRNDPVTSTYPTWADDLPGLNDVRGPSGQRGNPYMIERPRGIGKDDRVPGEGTLSPVDRGRGALPFPRPSPGAAHRITGHIPGQPRDEGPGARWSGGRPLRGPARQTAANAAAHPGTAWGGRTYRPVLDEPGQGQPKAVKN